jgi:hypothetical protein
VIVISIGILQIKNNLHVWLDLNSPIGISLIPAIESSESIKSIPWRSRSQAHVGILVRSTSLFLTRQMTT